MCNIKTARDILEQYRGKCIFCRVNIAENECRMYINILTEASYICWS